MYKVLTKTDPDNMDLILLTALGRLDTVPTDSWPNILAHYQKGCGDPNCTECAKTQEQVVADTKKVIAKEPLEDIEVLRLAFLEAESRIKAMHDDPIVMLKSIMASKGVEVQAISSEDFIDKPPTVH